MLTDEPILSSEGLDDYVRQSQHYSGSSVVLALGVRGGVPQKAADVPLGAHLEDAFPEMSREVEEPAALLLPSRRRPRRVKRGYTWLGSTYPELVKRNVKAGLHMLRKPAQVAKHRGVKCLAGAFAVVKDEFEDRVITDPSVSQLVDPEKLPRPKFAYTPKLRTITAPSTGRLVVTKRDARHYFHRLRIGRRWRRGLCGPPIRVAGTHGEVWRYPAACSAPMGFGPSAGWAQALTDVVADGAQLPHDSRLHPDFVVPLGFPVWGSIVDDIWCIDHEGHDGETTVGPEWLNRAEAAWVARGVEPNAKKSIDAAAGEEIQGYFVHLQLHWVGVSMEKRRYLFQGTIQVLMQRTVSLAVVERLVGKYGFAHSARPCLRSIFHDVYQWVTSMRSIRKARVPLPPTVWMELCMAALTLPYCSFNVSAPWSTRLECTDASMTGLGRAWGVVPTHVVQAIARYSDHGKVYTNLSLPWSIGLTHADQCPLRKVWLPIEHVRWSTVGCPWTPAHITLGEADAVL